MIDRVKTADFVMGFLRFGAGKRTLVILPGLSVQSVLTAAPAIEKRYEIFREDFTVFLFEPRQNLPAPYTVADMASDTAKAMKALGLSGVCLFGASLGGMVSQVIAASCPALVEKAVFASTVCHADEKRRAAVGEWIALAKAGKARELYLAFGEKIYPPEVFARYRDAFVTLSESVTREELARFAALAKGIDGFDARPLLSRVACPVLAIGDKQDALFGEEGVRELADAMKGNPRFESSLYDGFGHAAYDTAPDFPRRLYDFFTKS